MATEPAKQKRRLRPSSETVRSRAEKASQASEQSERKQEVQKTPSKFTAPFRAVAGPLKWFGRHFIPRYIRHAFRELHNVTWPGRKQSRQLTSAVLLFGIVFGFFVSVLDYGLDKVFKKVFLHE
jgi:preprotein translocase SecE subunit